MQSLGFKQSYNFYSCAHNLERVNTVWHIVLNFYYDCLCATINLPHKLLGLLFKFSTVYKMGVIRITLLYMWRIWGDRFHQILIKTIAQLKSILAQNIEIAFLKNNFQGPQEMLLVYEIFDVLSLERYFYTFQGLIEIGF